MKINLNNNKINSLVISALFLCIGIVLPFLTGQIKEFGDTLLPMHIPVMLCGLICGWKYGFAVGLILPFFRAVTVGMPPIYPNAVWMSAELAAYGFTTGFLYHSFPQKSVWRVYYSMFLSMLCGRIVWGITKAALLGVAGKTFTFEAFVAGAVTDSFPGILLQFVLIPSIMRFIDYKPTR